MSTNPTVTAAVNSDTFAKMRKALIDAKKVPGTHYTDIPAFRTPKAGLRVRQARKPRVNELENMTKDFIRQNTRDNALSPANKRLTTNPKKIRRTIRKAARRRQLEEQMEVLNSLAAHQTGMNNA